MLKTKKTPRIITRGNQGKANGFLLPLLNIHEPFLEPEHWPQQVYLTVAHPGEVKGPHLHKKRRGLFTCIKGNIKIVARIEDRYEEYFSGEDYDFTSVQVPAGIPVALVNIGPDDAYIINMPSPAWRAEDQDDWDVTFDDYSFHVEK